MYLSKQEKEFIYGWWMQYKNHDEVIRMYCSSKPKASHRFHLVTTDSIDILQKEESKRLVLLQDAVHERELKNKQDRMVVAVNEIAIIQQTKDWSINQ